MIAPVVMFATHLFIGRPVPFFQHPDCLPISIAPTDKFYGNWNQTCMEFLRSSPAPRDNCGLGPRDQINQVIISSVVIFSSVNVRCDRVLFLRNAYSTLSITRFEYEKEKD